DKKAPRATMTMSFVHVVWVFIFDLLSRSFGRCQRETMSICKSADLGKNPTRRNSFRDYLLGIITPPGQAARSAIEIPAGRLRDSEPKANTSSHGLIIWRRSRQKR